MFVCAVLFSSRSICIFIATTLHYFQLVVAFWFNVMSFDVCKAFINLVEQRSGADKSKKAPQVGATDTKKKTFKIYSCYAWGFPFVVVAASHVADQLSVLEDYRPAYAGHVDQPGNHMCWRHAWRGPLGPGWETVWASSTLAEWRAWLAREAAGVKGEV